MGHPQETVDDLEDDYEFVEKNKKYINAIVISPSVLFFDGSIIYKEREKYRSQIITTPEERQIYLEKISRLNENVDIFMLSVNALLYIAKKGLKNFIKDMWLLNIIERNYKLSGLYVGCYICLYYLKKNFLKLFQKKQQNNKY